MTLSSTLSDPASVNPAVAETTVTAQIQAKPKQTQTKGELTMMIIPAFALDTGMLHTMKVDFSQSGANLHVNATPDEALFIKCIAFNNGAERIINVNSSNHATAVYEDGSRVVLGRYRDGAIVPYVAMNNAHKPSN